MRFSTILTVLLAGVCGTFAQTPGFDPISKPSNWQDVNAGETFQIVWDPTTYKGTITMELLGGGSPATLWILGNIAQGIDNEQGKYDWAVPNDLGQLDTYGIRILLESDTSVLQYSFPFRVRPPTADGSGQSSTQSASQAATTATTVSSASQSTSQITSQSTSQVTSQVTSQGTSKVASSAASTVVSQVGSHNRPDSDTDLQQVFFADLPVHGPASDHGPSRILGDFQNHLAEYFPIPSYHRYDTPHNIKVHYRHDFLPVDGKDHDASSATADGTDDHASSAAANGPDNRQTPRPMQGPTTLGASGLWLRLCVLSGTVFYSQLFENIRSLGFQL